MNLDTYIKKIMPDESVFEYAEKVLLQSSKNIISDENYYESNEFYFHGKNILIGEQVNTFFKRMAIKSTHPISIVPLGQEVYYTIGSYTGIDGYYYTIIIRNIDYINKTDGFLDFENNVRPGTAIQLNGDDITAKGELWGVII